MNDFAWFKLLLRAIGILLIGLAIPSAAHALSMFAARFAEPAGAAYPLFWLIPSLIYPGTQMALGLYLILGGRALVRLCLRDVGDLCERCGYDLSGAGAGGVCPECGLQRERAAKPGPASPKNTPEPP